MSTRKRQSSALRRRGGASVLTKKQDVDDAAAAPPPGDMDKEGGGIPHCISVELFGARNLPEAPQNSKISCKLSLAGQATEHHTECIDWEANPRWNSTSWEWTASHTDMQTNKIDILISLIDANGSTSRIGSSVVPLDTLLLGSMPPTPAKFSDSTGSGVGVWYALHDTSGRPVTGAGGEVAEVEIAFSRRPNQDRAGHAKKEGDVGSERGRAGRVEAPGTPERAAARHPVVVPQLGLAGRLPGRSRSPSTSGKGEDAGRRGEIEPKMNGTSGDGEGEVGAEERRVRVESVAVEKSPASRSVIEKIRLFSEKERNVGEDAGGRWPVGREEPVAEGHRLVVFNLSECKGVEDGDTFMCELSIDFSRASGLQAAPPSYRIATKESICSEGVVWWGETFSAQLPDAFVSKATVSLTVIHVASIVRSTPVCSVKRKSLADLTSQSWMYAHREGGIGGCAASEGGDQGAEIHMRTEVTPALDPVVSRTESEEGEGVARVPSREWRAGSSIKEGSDDEQDSDAHCTVHFSRRSIIGSRNNATSTSMDQSEDDDAAAIQGWSRLASDEEDMTHPVLEEETAPVENHNLLHANGLDEGGGQRTTANGWSGGVLHPNGGGGARRKKPSPFALLDNIWENQVTEVNGDSKKSKSSQVVIAGEEEEETVLMKAIVVEPQCVADWVSKALALEKLMLVRERQAMVRERQHAELQEHVASLQYASAGLQEQVASLQVALREKEDGGGGSGCDVDGGGGGRKRDPDWMPRWTRMSSKEQFRRMNQRLEGKEKELEEERDKVMRLEEELAAERGRVEDLSRAVAESADCWTMLETSVCQRLQDFPRRQQQQQQQHHHQQQQAQNRSTSVPQSAFATPPREGRDEGREGTETSEDASPSRAKKRSLIC